MTGTELLREMQTRDHGAASSRIVISTDGSDSAATKLRALSVAIYVEKPFRPEEMRDVLTSLSAAS